MENLSVGAISIKKAPRRFASGRSPRVWNAVTSELQASVTPLSMKCRSKLWSARASASATPLWGSKSSEALRLLSRSEGKMWFGEGSLWLS
ncbi:MAG: hypothetical protein NZM04_03480 [Methylacidiphilales bacterium]|nr:hypothetical protein [Candidatus Methylacidiphilales bacterium]